MARVARVVVPGASRHVNVREGWRGLVRAAPLLESAGDVAWVDFLGEALSEGQAHCSAATSARLARWAARGSSRTSSAYGAVCSARADAARKAPGSTSPQELRMVSPDVP